MYKIIDGKAISEQIKTEIAAEVEAMIAAGKKRPHLAVIIVGHDGGSETYVAHKVKSCEQVGFISTKITFEADVTEQELLAKIDELNKNTDLDGFIVQLPLPKHISEQKVIEAIDYRKDVDGFHPINVGRMSIGSDNKILAERIFFSNQFKKESDFYVDCKDSRSGTKDKIVYSLSNKDKTGKLLKGDYSVTVYDLGLAPEDTLQDNIGSYMMLSSELTGKVFNPQQYFSTPSTTKERDLDLLLMVQGWRYYDISSIFESSFKTVR